MRCPCLEGKVRYVDKNAAMAISDLDRKIESLQAKKEAMIKKEKERKAKAQERWKLQLLRELMKSLPKIYGEDYEENEDPAALAAVLTGFLEKQMKEQPEEETEEQKRGGATDE